MKSGLGAFAICCALALPAIAGDSNDLLRTLVRADIATLPPDAAVKRFTKFVALERSQPVPATLLLAGGDARQRLELRYERDAGGAPRFAQGMLRDAAADSEAQFRSFERLLRQKLGKPRYERRDDGPMPTIGWRLGKLEVALSQSQRWAEVAITHHAASNL